MLRAAPWIIFLVTFVAGFGPLAFAEKRVALVIGNSDYRHTASLRNPRNDASDVAAVLRRLGFTVFEGLDLDRDGMVRHVRDFSAAIEGADVGLFYYAGHGLQVDGKNFLAPIDATLKSETELDFESIPLNLVLRQLELYTRLGLVFLDACRDNPMATRLARSLRARSRSVSVGSGLARVDKGVGMMISFATQPGNIALDGDGRNSPFTQALLDNIESEGTTIGDVMIQVRNDVIAATGGKQVPWENSTLTGKFYFKPTVAAEPRVAAYKRDLSDDASTIMVDHTFWTSIRDSDNPVLYRQYLERFPSGAFTPIAKAKLDSMRNVGRDMASGVTFEEAGLEARVDLTIPERDASSPATDTEGVGPRLTHDTQTALKSLGCYAGKIDGKWGRRSRAAMRRFNRIADLDLSLEPSAASLDILETTVINRGQLCPILTKKRATAKAKKRSTRKRTTNRRRGRSTRRSSDSYSRLIQSNLRGEGTP